MWCLAKRMIGHMVCRDVHELVLTVHGTQIQFAQLPDMF